MNKEFAQGLSVGSLTQPQGLDRHQRSAQHAQELFSDAVFMADQLNKNVTLTVKKTGEAQYEFTPREEKIDSSNGGPTITIFKAFTEIPLSTGSVNEQKKPNKEGTTELNEALEGKRRRREQNEAIFYGIRGKTVYQRGQPVNIKNGAVNPENGKTRSKRGGRGKRNGSR